MSGALARPSEVLPTSAGPRPIPALEAFIATLIRQRHWIFAVPTFAVIAWVFWVLDTSMLYAPVGGYDEQFFIWGGWSITKGLAPYRDFLEYKPPLLFLTHALAVALTDVRGHGYRLFFAFLSLGGFLALQASLVSRKVNAWLSAVALTGVVSLFVASWRHDTSLTDAESVGLAYFCFGLAFLLFQGKPEWRRWTDPVGAGFFALCVLSKEPFAPCVVASWGAVHLMKGGPFVPYLKRTTVGVAAVIGALMLYMVPTGAMAAYVEMVRMYFHMFQDPNTGYCVLLGRWKPGTPVENVLNTWVYLRRDLINLHYLSAMVPIFALAVFALLKRSLVRFGLGVVVLIAGLHAVTATHCQWSHYYNMPLAGALVVFAMGLEAASRELDRAGSAVKAILVVPLIAAMAAALWPRLEADRALQPHFYPPGEPIPGVLAFIAENSVPGDKIFTTGPPMLYVLADRVSAVKESSIVDELIIHYPGSTDEEKLKPIYDQLVKGQPKVVVLDPEKGDRKTRHLQVAVFPFLQRFNYRQAGPYYWVRP